MSDPHRIEREVVASLERLQAQFDVVHIDPGYANTAAFCERYGYTMHESANCILVAAKTGDRRYSANLVQATRRLDVNGVVRRLMGVRKASFATAEDTVEVTGMLPDGVTPFGLPAGIPVYVDAAVADLERVIVGGGSRRLKVHVATDVFSRMPDAHIIEGLAKQAP